MICGTGVLCVVGLICGVVCGTGVLCMMPEVINWCVKWWMI